MTKAVPVIDVSALRQQGEDGAVASAVADAVAQIADACREWGFFQVVGHGVPDALIDRVWDQTRRFFALPVEAKRATARSRENPRGYYDRELTKNQRDLKEVFDYGVVPYPDLPDEHPKNRDGINGANRWPAGLPDFRAAMIEHFRACETLGFSLMAAFCLGLDAPPDRLHRHFGREHTSFVRLNHYPLDDLLAPEEAAEVTALGDMALHHHTDAGVLTILLQDEVGGLQVFSGGHWRDVEPVAGAFVVNIGDMMQVWSNDRYRAAMHRVLPRGERARYSLPFFFNPTYDTDCAPLEALVAADGARYRPVNWGHFRQARTDGDFADYGKEIQLEDFRL